MSESNDPVVCGVGPALGGKGSPCPVVCLPGGKPWKVGWPTQEAKEEFELIVAEHAVADLQRRKRMYSVQVFAQKEKELEARFAGGDHLAYGALWGAAIDGPDSMPMFLLSLLKEHQPTATFADAKILWKSGAVLVRRAMTLVMPPFVTLLVEDSPRLQEQERPQAAAELTAAILERIGPVPPETAPTTNSAPTTSDAPTG